MCAIQALTPGHGFHRNPFPDPIGLTIRINPKESHLEPPTSWFAPQDPADASEQHLFLETYQELAAASLALGDQGAGAGDSESGPGSKRNPSHDLGGCKPLQKCLESPLKGIGHPPIKINQGVINPGFTLGSNTHAFPGH